MKIMTRNGTTERGATSNANQGKTAATRQSRRERPKLTVRFHNPNTEEVTRRFLTKVFVDVGRKLVEREMQTRS
jgi:hypothetical protein